MSEQLKLCPFCGGKAEIVDEGTYSGHTLFWVACLECDCRTDDYEDYKDKAISAWNRRIY